MLVVERDIRRPTQEEPEEESRNEGGGSGERIRRTVAVR